MKQYLLPLVVVLLASCEAKDTEEKNNEEKDSVATEHHHHHHGGANAYMHQSSVEELVERFEGKERDDYQQPDKVMALLGDVSGQKIMDIGAGSGYFSIRLAKAGADVIAADVDTGFQSYLRKRIQKEELQDLKLELRLIPYEHPSLAKEEVNKVLIVNTYHHIEDRIPYFKNVLFGLKKDGELVVIDFFKKELPVGPPIDHKIDRATVVKELRSAGFTQIDQDTTSLPYQYILRARK